MGSPGESIPPFHTTALDEQISVTFDEAGRPDKTIIPLTEAPLLLLEVPLADLTDVGDSKTLQVGQDGTQESVTVTVDAVLVTDEKYELTLAVSYQAGFGGDPFAGPHTLTASLQQGNLLWQSQTLLTDVSGMPPNEIAIGTQSTVAGVLAK